MRNHAYNVMVPELVRLLDEQSKLESEPPAKFLIMKTGVSVGTCYNAVKGKHVSMDSLWDLYRGLKKHGVTVDFGDGARTLKFSDFYEETE